MKITIKGTATGLFFSLALGLYGNAQDLEPRAYIRVPVRLNVITTGISYSEGGVLTDPAIPLQDLHARVGSASLGYLRSFSFFGLTAQALGWIPYSWLKATALVDGQPQSAYRSAIGDMRLRLSVLLIGAPAVNLAEFAKTPPRTILGMSLTILTPTGQNFSDKLINVGTGRWGIKPELALSYPAGKRWLLDLYAGIWFYTKNDFYYPGNTAKTQNPIVSFQGHVSYTIKLNMWAALDATYYSGGNSSLNGQPKNDRLSNVRLGATLALPAGKGGTLKLAFSDGAYVIAGTNFISYSLGWSYTWL